MSESPAHQLRDIFYLGFSVRSKPSLLNEKRAPSKKTREGTKKRNTARFDANETAKKFQGERKRQTRAPNQPSKRQKIFMENDAQERARLTPRPNGKIFSQRTARTYTPRCQTGLDKPRGDVSKFAPIVVHCRLETTGKNPAKNSRFEELVKIFN